MEKQLHNRPLEYLKGVGPDRAQVIREELGIDSAAGLLEHFPIRYIDRSTFLSINKIETDAAYVQLVGRIVALTEVGGGKSKRLIADFRDETGAIELIWFQQYQYVLQKIKVGESYLVFGKPNFFGRKKSIPHPEILTYQSNLEERVSGLQPIYPSTDKMKRKGLDSKGLLKIIHTLLDSLQPEDIPEHLPGSVLNFNNLVTLPFALQWVHRPKDQEELAKARKRLKFDELFLLQTRILLSRLYSRRDTKGFVCNKPDAVVKDFYTNYKPFELTKAQVRVLKEIRADMITGRQMNRLIQGDVGSGKTIVALYAMLIALDNGFQSAFMAPTEILAQQHFAGLSTLLQPLGIPVQLLTGSVKGKDREIILNGIKSGYFRIIIGTHALIEDAVSFHSLGLAVIDEQHRFGVAQRAKLWKKDSISPHVLVMTATPIPRTLAMTTYGDLDVSVIDELPPGRKPIKTLHYYDSQRLSYYEIMRREIEKGRQIYVVFPLIEESETLDLKSLAEGYELIKRNFPEPDYSISMVHGRMKNEDKEFEMQRFSKGLTNILVATTVIEVGVNVPNASVMIIENAERFGLSQLHQLRGRVGRGSDQSYCVLVTSNKLGENGKIRMNTMVSTNDGFKIAEVDLSLRGPGDITGTRQSGILDLQFTDLTKDHEEMKQVRRQVEQMLEDDPGLKKNEHQPLLTKLKQDNLRKRSFWMQVS